MWGRGPSIDIHVLLRPRDREAIGSTYYLLVMRLPWPGSIPTKCVGGYVVSVLPERGRKSPTKWLVA
eukprot:6953394-Prymnesium_polylepis.1